MRFEMKAKTGYMIAMWTFFLFTAIAYVNMIVDIIIYIVELLK